MRPSLRSVIDRCVSEGELAAEDEKRLRAVLEAQQRERPVPWFIKALIGAGAWFAAGLFLLFLALAGAFDSTMAAFVLGALLVTGGVLLRRSSSTALAVQAALSMSLVGQGLMCFAVTGFSHFEDLNALAAMGLVLSAILLFAFPDPVHRFLSTIVATGSIAILLVQLDTNLAVDVAIILYAAGTFFVWLQRDALDGPWAELQGPVAHGLSLSLLFASSPDSFGYREAVHAPIVTAALTAGVLWILVRVFEVPAKRPGRAFFGAVAAVLLIALCCHRVPGLIAALAMMLLAVRRRNVLLLGEAAVAFVVFLSWYYYSLDVTLLEKSVALAITGGVLLLGWKLLDTQKLPEAAR